MAKTIPITLDSPAEDTAEVAAPSKALLQRFQVAGDALRTILEDYRRSNPHAGLYLDGTGNVHLMAGPSYTGRRCRARQEHILATFTIRGFQGGDW